MANMTNYYQAVLFDLDGTLVDTAPDFTAVINQQRQHYALPAIDNTRIRHHVGNGSRDVVTHGLFQELSPEQQADNPIDSLQQDFLTRFEHVNGRHAQLFKGMQDILSFLKHRHLPWGIVTQKPFRYTQPLLHKLGLDKYCHVLVCPDHITHSKPHPEGLFRACDNLGLETHASLYVGDNERDILAGQNADMHTVVAEYGYIAPSLFMESATPLWNATHSINSPHTLEALIKNPQ